MSHFNNIKDKIDAKDFAIPIKQTADEYFPDFLSNLLNKYINNYTDKLVPLVDETIPFIDNKKNVIITKIEKLSISIIETVQKYYEGSILEATLIFNQALEDVFFHDLQNLDFVDDLDANNIFYRARKNENCVFSKEDLFHIKLEDRHIVSTNRYSVPGFPALYLGDSTYTCWEEFGQHKLRDLFFSKFKNTSPLKIVRIEKIEDLFINIESKKDDTQIAALLSYFVLFPLTLACSIKVKYSNANFKPEYIIPQLLLQYISKKDEIHGLKFLSTRIDYSKLSNIKGYNYVFPVKKIKKNGFCDFLLTNFHCTEPTSLELEEIIHNPSTTTYSHLTKEDDREIELIRGIKSKYSNTSFGKLEFKLSNRKTDKI